MLDQDDNFYLIGLSILITSLLNNVWDIMGRSYVLITSGSYRVKCLARKNDLARANPAHLNPKVSAIKFNQCVSLLDNRK